MNLKNLNKKITVRISDQIYEKLLLISKNRKTDISSCVRNILEIYFCKVVEYEHKETYFND